MERNLYALSMEELYHLFAEKFNDSAEECGFSRHQIIEMVEEDTVTIGSQRVLSYLEVLKEMVDEYDWKELPEYSDEEHKVRKMKWREVSKLLCNVYDLLKEIT